MDGVEGVVDNSGFKMRLTTKLRPYDVGILTLVSMVLPVSNYPSTSQRMVIRTF